MRNQLNHPPPPPPPHHHHLHHNHKSTFLPILCSRPSIKDVAIPNSASSSSSDPLSPRVGCMGQVKRNNRVVGFPTSHRLTVTTTTAAAKNANSIKYSKLKKFFSAKNLVATPGSISGSRRELIVGGRRGSSKIDCHEDENYGSVINVVDLDPPLPVIKRVQPQRGGDGEDSGSLWKRRSGGVALKTLQLQPLHPLPHSLQPTSV